MNEQLFKSVNDTNTNLKQIIANFKMKMGFKSRTYQSVRRQRTPDERSQHETLEKKKVERPKSAMSQLRGKNQRERPKSAVSITHNHRKLKIVREKSPTFEQRTTANLNQPIVNINFINQNIRKTVNYLVSHPGIRNRISKRP